MQQSSNHCYQQVRIESFGDVLRVFMDEGGHDAMGGWHAKVFLTNHTYLLTTCNYVLTVCYSYSNSSYDQVRIESFGDVLRVFMDEGGDTELPRVNPTPSTLNPQPSTLNPKLSNLNPKP